MLTHYLRKGFATLVLGEHNGKQFSKNSLKLLGAAERLKEECHVLVCGQETEQIVEHIKSVSGTLVSRIIQAKIKHVVADGLAALLRDVIQKHKYRTVVGINSTFGKDIVPRIAGHYLAQPITDIIEIIDPNTFIRPTYAGNVLTKVTTKQAMNFLTFRGSSFEEIKAVPGNPIVQVQISQHESKAKFVKQERSDGSRPQLTTARVVISGGRGLKNKQNFNLIYQLADAFGNAAVGASRAAVDSGYCPNEMQVGQTGKVVAPQLYIAVGISGAVQHLAGMKDSKVIVAINNRPDEPIFEVATYGLEADLFKAVPELTEKIRKLKSG